MLAAVEDQLPVCLCDDIDRMAVERECHLRFYVIRQRVIITVLHGVGIVLLAYLFMEVGDLLLAEGVIELILVIREGRLEGILYLVVETYGGLDGRDGHARQQDDPQDEGREQEASAGLVRHEQHDRQVYENDERYDYHQYEA